MERPYQFRRIAMGVGQARLCRRSSSLVSEAHAEVSQLLHIQDKPKGNGFR